MPTLLMMGNTVDTKGLTRNNNWVKLLTSTFTLKYPEIILPILLCVAICTFTLSLDEKLDQNLREGLYLGWEGSS